MMRPAQVEALNGLSIDGLELVSDDSAHTRSMQAYYQEVYIGTAFNNRFDAWHGLRGSTIVPDLVEKIRKAYLE
jgi:hypothetical protein